MWPRLQLNYPTFDFYLSESNFQCYLPLFLVFPDTWELCMCPPTYKLGVACFDKEMSAEVACVTSRKTLEELGCDWSLALFFCHSNWRHNKWWLLHHMGLREKIQSTIALSCLWDESSFRSAYPHFMC